MFVMVQMPVVKEWIPSRPPPFLDAKLNSKCYPTGSDWLDNWLAFDDGHDTNLPGYLRVRDFNIKLKLLEKKEIFDAKSKNWKEQEISQQGTRGERKYCKICSQFQGEDGRLRVYQHIHCSSKYDRVIAELNEDGQYYCNHCIKYHYVKTGERTPLVISSSTLAGWRGEPRAHEQVGDPIHLDWDLIRGGKIRTAIHSIKAQYERAESPVDAFIMLGLNDLLEGTSVSRIWQSYMKLTNLLRSIGSNHWTGPSTVAIGTVLMPPALCRFTTIQATPRTTLIFNSKHDLPNINRPEYVAVHKHIPLFDRKQDILQINRMIGEFNNKPNGTKFDVSIAPAKFHTYGLKFRRNNGLNRPRNQMDLAVGHRYQQWREELLSEQLHLDDAKRWQMGNAIITYYKELYGITI